MIVLIRNAAVYQPPLPLYLPALLVFWGLPVLIGANGQNSRLKCRDFSSLWVR